MLSELYDPRKAINVAYPVPMRTIGKLGEGYAVVTKTKHETIVNGTFEGPTAFQDANTFARNLNNQRFAAAILDFIGNMSPSQTRDQTKPENTQTPVFPEVSAPQKPFIISRGNRNERKVQRNFSIVPPR